MSVLLLQAYYSSLREMRFLFLGDGFRETTAIILYSYQLYCVPLSGRVFKIEGKQKRDELIFFNELIFLLFLTLMTF